uniref:Uncharacterized protein n=1 Tax=Vitis vinifera TaxID=29760 RepID=A5BVN2_VITVI|nr:hypothetical protein VITISV_039465 [Vitis vinifera]
MAYDSSMGGCLLVLHSTCSGDVKLTAADLINVLRRSILNTKSLELKVALCNASIQIAKTCPPHIWKPESLIYTLDHRDLIWLGELTPILKNFQVALCNASKQIAKTCPPHIWKPESLIYTLLSLEPCLPLIDCFQAALSILGPDCVGVKTSDTSVVSSTSSDKRIENLRVGGKRPIQDQDICKSKRQKLEEESMASDAEVHVSCKLSHIVTCEREQEHANYMHTSFLSFVELLKPPVVKDKPFRPEVSLTALSMLCIVFSKYPQTNMSIFIT